MELIWFYVSLCDGKVMQSSIGGKDYFESRISPKSTLSTSCTPHNNIPSRNYMKINWKIVFYLPNLTKKNVEKSVF